MLKAFRTYESRIERTYDDVQDGIAVPGIDNPAAFVRDVEAYYGKPPVERLVIWLLRKAPKL